MGGRSLPLTGAEVAANGTQSDGENFGQDQPHVTSRRIYGGVPTPKQRIRRGMDAGTEETLHCWGFGLPLVAERKWQWYQGSLDDVWGQIYKDFFSLVSIRSPLEQSYRNFKKASNALIKRLIWNINSADTYVVLEQCDRQIMLRHARLHGRKRTQVVDQINNRRRAAACSRSLRRRARPTSTTSLLARTSLPRTPAATRRRRRSGACASAAAGAARPAAAARPRAPTTPARSARPPRCTRAAAYTCVCQVDR
jgi:hypothetical protein